MLERNVNVRVGPAVAGIPEGGTALNSMVNFAADLRRRLLTDEESPMYMCWNELNVVGVGTGGLTITPDFSGYDTCALQAYIEKQAEILRKNTDWKVQ